MKDESLLTGLLATAPLVQLTEAELMFEKAAQSYIDKFGGALPLGIGMPDITTDLLLKAVAENREIEDLPIPKDAVS